jgi:hypothetical protein
MKLRPAADSFKFKPLPEFPLNRGARMAEQRDIVAVEAADRCNSAAVPRDQANHGPVGISIHGLWLPVMGFVNDGIQRCFLAEDAWTLVLLEPQ